MFINLIRLMMDADPGAGGAVTLEAVEKAVSGLSDAAQKSFKTINEQIKTLNENGATKSEIAAFKAEIAKCNTDLKAVNELAENLQKELKGKTIGEAQQKTFCDEIATIVEKNHSTIVAGKGAKIPIEYALEGGMTRKDMSFAGNTTGTVVAPDFNPTILGQPFQIPHLRTLVRVGSTSSNAYYYPVAKLKSGAVGSVAPGGTKPEIQFQIDGKIASVIKLAAHVRLPEEMLDDVSGLTSYLQNYMPEEVYKAEDGETLNGDGTTGHFDGLLHQATTHVLSPGVDGTEPWDVFANAIAIQMNKWLPGNRFLINPIEWMFMATRKNDNGTYSYPTLLLGAPLTVNGVPILPHPLMGTDEYLLGDFNLAELKIRKGLTVRFFDQDQDNAIKNMVTVVAEERAAFAVYYPDAFLKGTFQTS